MIPAEDLARLERRARELLEESTQQVGGHVRSRLNRARHAALEQAMTARPHFGGPRLWMPAAGVVAAAAVAAVMLWPRAPQRAPVSTAATAATSADLDLLTDSDGPTLVANGDGEFYEWAVYEAQAQQGTGAGAEHAD